MIKEISAYSVERIAYSQSLSASRKSGIPQGTNRCAGKCYPLNAKRFWISICSFAFCVLGFTLICHAEEITILYTGETHAMLYPCSCPKEPDGGVSRRVALIKKLRKTNPGVLLLDSGNFFAGGLLDEYTQNMQLDMQRALINLKAMDLMQYDALAIGEAEFNFGSEFLKNSIDKTRLNFLACNIHHDTAPGLFKPYLVKEIKGLKIGIIGVTALSAMQKAREFKFIEPKLAVKKAVEELRQQNAAEIIILLSNLEESENSNLIKDAEGIDILVAGHTVTKNAPSSRIGSTMVVRPSWQARRLGKLTLTLTDKKITNYKAEELRLSDKINDDPQILSILPRCFSDAQCKQKGLIGVCQNAGNLDSHCLFTEAAKINLLIIVPKVSRVHDAEKTVNYLKTQFPGLVASYLYYPGVKASKLLKDFNIKSLPVYLLGKEVEKEKPFDNLKQNLEPKGNFYMLKPQVSGISYFLEREKKEGKLDLFISLFDKNAPQLLNTMKDFFPTVHFLATQHQTGFDAGKGNLEVEEYLRAVCVEKYYPQEFWDYISCRVKFINSSWWEDCLPNADTGKIKNCSRSDEGAAFLGENIGLNKELQIMSGPTYLLDNREIFRIPNIPTKEEFKKILNKK